MMLRASAFCIVLLLAQPAYSQPAQTQRVVGTIERVDGPKLIIKQRQGEDTSVTLADNVQVFGVSKATIADVKPGVFIGVGATPQGDGSQLAIQVTIFAETQRGLGEGHRPWNRPNTTMTNATVDSTVTGVNGQELKVKYKDGEQKIVIPKDAIILAYSTVEKSELKPGANVAINNATKKPDGTLETARVNVGRDVVPQ
jgi:outer membrane lipoprotein SlyB